MLRSMLENPAPARANACRVVAPGRVNTWRAWLTALLVCVAAPLKAEEGPAFEFDIPAGALEAALVNYSMVSDVSVSWAPEAVRGLEQPGLKGAYTPSQALQRLLADTGLDYRLTAENTVTVGVASETETTSEATPEDPPESLPRLDVEGKGVAETGAERDLRRKDEIFDEDMSTDYLGKADIDRFRGISTADVFQGLTNVYSGAARNGGALDANIRGIQGAGRAPVIIDGTEQAIVAYRGYSGFSNRSYIDPSLISGIQALKGPVSVREVNSQSGGAIAIKTLGAADILRPGERFGVELRLEAGNNATAPRLPTLRTGQDARNVPGFLPNIRGYAPYIAPTLDPTLRVQPRAPGDNGPFAFGGDRAARLAVAGRKGAFDFFGAYAHRSRGNYFSGKNNADYYSRPAGLNVLRTESLTSQYPPGYEVTNSSSEMRSWLFKSTWRVADDQALQLGYRNTRSATGEIMPSRIINRGALQDRRGFVQWPLSRIRIDALNLEYKYAPETPWLDVHANLWTTRADSNTYSSGGFPNIPRSRRDPTLINTALSNSRNNRWGVTFSNKMALLPSVDLTVGGHYQYEKLRPYEGDINRPSGFLLFGAGASRRAGNRQEYRANVQLEWRPTGFLTFNGGVGHAGYRGFDDGLHARLKGGGGYSQTATVGYRAGYRLYAKGSVAYRAFNPPSYAAQLKTFQDRLRKLEKESKNFNSSTTDGERFANRFLQRSSKRRIQAILSGDAAREYESRARRFENKSFAVGDFSREWRADASGRFRRANRPPLCNQAAPGDFDLKAVSKEIAADTKRQPFVGNRILNPGVRQGISEVGCSNSTEFSGEINKTTELKSPADNPVWRASGWEPYLTATLKLSDAIRLYGRYAERLRFPSLFESTIGFSASPSLFRPLKPERIRAWEGAYIQDFSALFGLGGEGQRADFKLVYFHNTVRDVIDRDGFIFANYDQQIIDGVELQARLDTGRFFLTLGAARILNNKVIDESAAAVGEFNATQQSVASGSNARTHGFGQLQNQGVPPLTVNLTLGGRFFERRLELGARTTWYSAHNSRQLYVRQDGRLLNYNLITRTFDKTLVLDAYARYNFNDQLTAELVSTNITDQYYADPLSLSDIPAPGRQIRLNFTYQF